VLVLVETKLRGGQCLVFMKPKLLSWNVKRLNKVDKSLRIRNLLRQWKP